MQWQGTRQFARDAFVSSSGPGRRRTVVAVPNTSDQPDDVSSSRSPSAIWEPSRRSMTATAAWPTRSRTDPREGEAAEDVVHDAYISAWRGAATYRRERGTFAVG